MILLCAGKLRKGFELFLFILLAGFAWGCQGESSGSDKKKKLTAREIIEGKGECMACHTWKKDPYALAPAFNGLYGSKQTVIAGSGEKTITVDEEYLRRAIVNPKAEIVKGYPDRMWSYENILTKEEIDKVVDYIKSLGEKKSESSTSKEMK